MTKSANFVRAEVHYHLTPGESLKQLRELQEMSQSTLAELTGISQSNISALENGSRQFGKDRALLFAKVLHVHPAVLLFPDFDMRDVA